MRKLKLIILHYFQVKVETGTSELSWLIGLLSKELFNPPPCV